jgi:prevent-host-death family protein
MAQVNTHEAKTHLSKLLARVEAGEEIAIARSGKVIARLVPANQPHREVRFGTAAGTAHLLDGWDAPLYTDDELDALDAAPLFPGASP